MGRRSLVSLLFQPSESALIRSSIDQSNSKERGHQVSNMQKIYKRALNVIVWLGAEDPGRAKQAIYLIEYCLRHILDEVGINRTKI